MITQYEITNLLKEEIPQLGEKFYLSKITLEVYVSINYFSDYTKQVLEKHDFNLAKKCFFLAEKLYKEGDKVVRFLIENIFVYNFSGFLFNNKVESTVVKSMIPPVLYSLYISQVAQSGF